MTDQRDPDDDSVEPGFRESFVAALRKSGFGQVEPGEAPTARALLAAVGGIRGLIESIVPGLGFLVVYTVTHNLVVSVLAPLGLALVFVIVRVITRSAVVPALSGILLLAISAVLALVSGRPENNFVFGMWINAIFLAVILVSILVRWPLIGVIAGFLTNDLTGWRADRRKRRVLFAATWLWAGLFSIRLIVEVPLYLAHETTLLAGARLITGVPLYAIFLWVTWLLVRSVFSRGSDTTSEGITR